MKYYRVNGLIVVRAQSRVSPVEQKIGSDKWSPYPPHQSIENWFALHCDLVEEITEEEANA